MRRIPEQRGPFVFRRRRLDPSGLTQSRTGDRRPKLDGSEPVIILFVFTAVRFDTLFRNALRSFPESARPLRFPPAIPGLSARTVPFSWLLLEYV